MDFSKACFVQIKGSNFQRKGVPDEKKDESEPALKLRNYRPNDEKILRDEVEPAEVEAVDEHVEDLEKDAKADGKNFRFHFCSSSH